MLRVGNIKEEWLNYSWRNSFDILLVCANSGPGGLEFQRGHGQMTWLQLMCCTA